MFGKRLDTQGIPKNGSLRLGAYRGGIYNMLNVGVVTKKYPRKDQTILVLRENKGNLAFSLRMGCIYDSPTFTFLHLGVLDLLQYFRIHS